ncbi:2-oxoglutarate-Fe(II) type oxidoreductase-like isoform X1, variant 2 [Balamuthia mandrillaris]
MGDQQRQRWLDSCAKPARRWDSSTWWAMACLQRFRRRQERLPNGSSTCRRAKRTPSLSLSLLASGLLREGYQKLGENVTLQKKDWHEAIDLHRDDLNPQSPSMHEVEALLGDWIYSPNQWPSLPSDFKPFFQQYIREMLRLGEDMMRAIAMSLELPSEDFFVEKNLTNESYWVMRVIGYPTLDRSVPDLGLSCGEHCDYGCLTIVNQDDTKGALQVKNTAGQWINADPIPGAFVVNLGDMLHVWSNGRYQSTPHRVVNAGTNYRISIPFFYEPNIDCVVEPLLSSSSSSSSSSSNTADKSFKKKVHYGAHLKSKIFNNFKFDE